jgi:aspartokinase/homoserine dehydrogenase 1
MRPAMEKNIPLHIRNTFEPAHPGTCISPVSDPEKAPPLHSKDHLFESVGLPRSVSGVLREEKSIFKGLTSVNSLALFNLEGVGMMGVPGIATRLFAALHKEKVNVIFIAQASSEHSICFAIPANQSHVAKASIDEAFFKEIHYKHVQPVTFIEPVSVIAIVGDNMTNTVGVSGMLFSALGAAGVNVLAISQGSSQRNISAVVSEKDVSTALQAIHDKMLL